MSIGVCPIDSGKVIDVAPDLLACEVCMAFWSPEDLAEPKESPLAGQVLRIVKGIDTPLKEDEQDYVDAGHVNKVSTDLDEANIITSEVSGKEGVHKILIDIDFPAKLIPSSTPGHHHLIIDKEMPKKDYLELLDILADFGLLEPGYVAASQARGYSALRLPWVKKPAPICRGCGLTPEEIPEYAELAEREGYASATAACRGEEGTLNKKNQRFWCSACYIKAGTPLGVAA